MSTEPKKEPNVEISSEPAIKFDWKSIKACAIKN